MKREEPIQKAIVDYLRLQYPRAITHHCRNEINKRGANIARELARAKQLGAVAGFPDIIFLPGERVAFFEVKAEGNYASPAQKAVHQAMADLGYFCAVVRSIDDVKEALSDWGISAEIRGLA